MIFQKMKSSVPSCTIPPLDCSVLVSRLEINQPEWSNLFLYQRKTSALGLGVGSDS